MDTSSMDLIFDLDFDQELFLEKGADALAKYVALIPYSESKPEDLEQLKAIFKSINIDFETEVMTVAMHTLSNQILRIKEKYPSADYFFLFGINPVEVGIAVPLPLYSVTNLDPTHLVMSERLTTLQKNIDSKKKLWFCLKNHFLDK